MHVSHAYHIHDSGTAASIWTYDVLWEEHIGATNICDTVWCSWLSNTPGFFVDAATAVGRCPSLVMGN